MRKSWNTASIGCIAGNATECTNLRYLRHFPMPQIPMDTLKDHSGTDIPDRHSAFETFASKSGNDQQYCWSHIICDAKELEDFYGDDESKIKRSLQTIYDEAKEYHGLGTTEDVE